MSLATKTNAEFDSVAAAVPAPYGPLTRVTDLEAAPTHAPNSQIKAETTSTPGVTVWISFDEMNTVTPRNHILKEAHGVNSAIQDFEDMVVALNVLFTVTEWDSLTTGAEDWTKIARIIQAMANIGLSIPTQAYDEVGDSNTVLLADFSVVQSGTGNRDVVFTNLSTGLYHYILWVLDDGSIVQQDPVPDPFTYAGAGADTFNPLLILIGPQGVDTATVAVAVT